jgi:hypothetical protein
VLAAEAEINNTGLGETTVLRAVYFESNEQRCRVRRSCDHANRSLGGCTQNFLVSDQERNQVGGLSANWKLAINVSALSEARPHKKRGQKQRVGARVRQSRQKEAARGCGGRGALWEFNRFLPEKPCQTGLSPKKLLLQLIDVALRATMCGILPPAPFVLQEDSSDACVYTRGSVRRASGFVPTGFEEVDRIVTVKPAWGNLDSTECEPS